MPEPTPPAPPAERLADRLEARPTRRRSAAAVALHELGAIDRAVYRAIASTPTPTIDEPLRRLSNLASHSKLWLGVAGAMFGLGGPTGRRVAVTGVVAVGVTSAVVNLPMKFAARRARPDRDTAGVPGQRRVPMPETTSFPSGHSASGFAFAGAVGASLPVARDPAARARCGRRLLTRAHRCALPRRRRRRVARRHDDRPSDGARGAAPVPSPRQLQLKPWISRLSGDPQQTRPSIHS